MAADPSWGAIDWNDDLIPWRNLESGLHLARINGKPVVLILYADWCATCHAYDLLFESPTVVDATVGFVMIRANVAECPEIDSRFAFDGSYLPRVLIFTAAATFLHQIYPADQAFRYLVRPDQANVLTALMSKAAAQIAVTPRAR